MSSQEQALDRADRIARGFGISGEPARNRDGWSNDVWMYDDLVIRVAAHPGPGTLTVEAELAPRLPAAVGYPRLLGSGEIDGHEWMVQDRLSGENLACAWQRLESDQRAFAVSDLCARLDAVAASDVTGLDLPATPLYAFAPDLLEQQLATARRIVGDAVVARAGDLVQAGLDAARSAPAGLVHTDVVLTNVIWTGSAAIPVDFEFACVGPVDLDVDCVGREVVGRRDRIAIEGLRDALASTLERAGAIQRLRGYSLLRDLWALGKWADHDPSLTDATTWGPARDLIADTTQSGWIDQLLDAEH